MENYSCSNFHNSSLLRLPPRLSTSARKGRRQGDVIKKQKVPASNLSQFLARSNFRSSFILEALDALARDENWEKVAIAARNNNLRLYNFFSPAVRSEKQ